MKVGPKALVLKFLFLGELRFGRKRHVVYFCFFLITFWYFLHFCFRIHWLVPKTYMPTRLVFTPKIIGPPELTTGWIQQIPCPTSCKLTFCGSSKQGVWPLPLIGMRETYGQWIQLTMKLPPTFLPRDGPNDFGGAENPGWCFFSSWCMVVVLVRTFPSKTMLVSSEIAVDGSEFPAPGQGNDKF